MTKLSNRFASAVRAAFPDFGRSSIGPVAIASGLLLLACGGTSKGAASPGSNGGAGGARQAEVGKPAPDLSIQTLNGKGKVSLDSLQGKVVIVDFWATWCGPCKQSFPKLEELSKKVGDKAEIVGVSVDDEVKGVADFAKTNGATFAIGWDEGHAIAGRWGNISTMPTTFVVDRSGKVRFIHSGYHDGETDEMAKEVATLLDESSSDTRVAKHDPPSEKDKAEAKGAKPESSSEAKETKEPKNDPTPVSSAHEEKAAPTPPAKKAAATGKKGGKPPAKTAQPKKKPVKKK